MKNFNRNIVLFLVLLTFILAPLESATVKIQLTAQKEVKESGYSLCLVNSVKDWNQFDSVYISPDGKFNLTLEPGFYTMGFQNVASERVMYYLFIDNPDSQIDIDVSLQNIVLPKKIDKVALIGNFNSFQTKNSVDFEFDAATSTWKIPVKKIPEKLEKYRVKINDSLVLVLPYNKLTVPGKQGNYSNKYDKEIIEFKPLEFSSQKQEPKIETIGPDPDFNEMLKTILHGRSLRDSTYKLYSAIKENKSVDINSLMKGYESYYSQCEKEYSDLKVKYSPKYSQFLIENDLEFMNLGPISVKRTLLSVKGDRDAVEELEKKDEYVNFVIKEANLIKSIDKASNQLTGNFIYYLSMLDYYCERMDLYSKLDLPIGYFRQFPEDVLKVTPLTDVKVKVLINKAQFLSHSNPDKAAEIYMRIKTEFPNNKNVKDGTVDNYIKGFMVKKGTNAPEFKVTTLDKKEIKLSDYKGKYVFIDFWGTWCAPCRGEIPNVKKLNEELGGSSLVVIGLMSDNEEDAIKYIKEQKIKYLNAIADKNLLNKFGVQSFPTTLLIDKEGKIIAKNLRGEELVESVKKAMEQK